jgi:hypothetical protein
VQNKATDPYFDLLHFIHTAASIILLTSKNKLIKFMFFLFALFLSAANDNYDVNYNVLDLLLLLGLLLNNR